MEIILLKDVEKVGKKGEVINVRDGFGRNFLLPRALALPATRANRVSNEKQKERAAVRKTHKKEDAQSLATNLASLVIQLEVKTGEKDKLFGSVTAQDVVRALKEKGFTLNKRQIHIPEPIRNLGSHTVTVELEADVKTSLRVEVVKKKNGIKSGNQS